MELVVQNCIFALHLQWIIS